MPSMQKGFIGPFAGAHEPFSNFHEGHPQIWRGREYPTNEHFYQAHKATQMTEHEWVRSALSPGAAKSRGRQVAILPTWNDDMHFVMLLGLYLKFTQHPTLGTLLISTGATRLVEFNVWHDNRWGDCTCGNSDGEHPQCLDPGENLLGKYLEKTRAAIQVGDHT
jgi:ribA/ribD-fused uncharacterized protein